MSKEKIGFIGLGKMGRPMASNLAGQGYNVQAYDVRPEAAEDLEESGVAWGGSVSNVSEKSSVNNCSLNTFNAVLGKLKYI